MFRYLFILMTCASIISCSGSTDPVRPSELVPISGQDSRFLMEWFIGSDDEEGDRYASMSLFHSDASVFVAQSSGLLRKIDIADGELVGSLDLERRITQGIGGASGRLLVASEDGEVIAIDADSLTVSWEARLPSAISALPVTVGGDVYVRTSDGGVYALQAEDGSIRWSYKQTMPALTLSGSSRPIVIRGGVIVGMDNGRLLALAPDTGEVLWDLPFTVPEGRSEIERLVDIDGDGELYGSTLYLASYQGRMAAIDVFQGKVDWTRPFSSYTGLIVAGNTLYSVDEESVVWAIDRRSGATLWKQDALSGRKLSRPVIVGDLLVMGDFEGYLHAVSPETGTLVARTNVNDYPERIENYSGINSAPLVIGESLLASTINGSVVRLSIH